jgi:hypothetical protein
MAPANPIARPPSVREDRRMMIPELSCGELSILHSLRDGDDPILRVPESELVFFSRDVARLLHRGLIERSGQRFALTIDGLDELAKPASRAAPADLYCDPAYLHRMFGAAALAGDATDPGASPPADSSRSGG